ncbi:unnamed protein product [Orchesella dallaii]|uniref:Uncharacterized protein n=1 Tax=Orchesella dallaii TaxID=48710 RepID=A0ABP1R7C6_9HEXA
MSNETQEERLARILGKDNDNEDIGDIDLFPPVDLDELPSSQIEQRPCSSSKTSNQSNIASDITFLTIMDPERRLGIWEYVRNIDKDVLVREYMSLLKSTGFFPEQPDSQLLKESNLVPKFDLSQDCQVKVINLLTNFLSCHNFISNVKQATDCEVTLFQPLTKFYVPQYSLLPGQTFEEFEKYKKMCVLGMQGSAVLGSKFTSELLLLRSFKIINNEVSLQYDSQNECEEVTKHLFLTLFVATRNNYLKVKKTKVIDWKTKQGKVHGSCPGWRKANIDPPSGLKSKYAESLINAVVENKLKLDKITVVAQLDQVNTTSHNNFSTDNKQKRRPPPSRPIGPKDIRKSNQRQNRQKNPMYDRNREISNEINVQTDRFNRNITNNQQ